MRRGVVLVAGFALFVAGCAAEGETAPSAAPASSGVASPPPIAPSGAAPSPAASTSPAPAGNSRAAIRAACRSVDTAYQALDDEARARIFEGVDAEGRGNKEGVRDALTALRPVFVTMATTFREAAGRVSEPQVQGALTRLAEAADRELTFTTFAEFDAIEAMVKPAETTLKRECSKVGTRLKNVE